MLDRVSIASYLATSIAAVLATDAAYAVGPSTAPDLVVYAGGGSAEAQPVEAAFCRNFNNVDLYVDNGALVNSFSKSYLVLYGTSTGANNGVAAGKNVLFIYKYNGGSYANGAIPEASGSTAALNYPTQASILNTTTTTLITSSASPTATAGTTCTAAQKGLPTYQYTPTLGNQQRPLFGITDQEVAAYAGDNNPSYPAALVTVGGSALLYDVVFGVAVTNTLYTGTATYNKKTNFSRAEVAAILAGQITDWHNIYADNGSPVAPAGSGIILLDRNVGSGTKAAGSSYFLGYSFPLGAYSIEPTSKTNSGGAGNGTGNGSPTNAPFNSGYSPGGLVNSQTYQDIQETNASALASDLVTADNDGLLAIAIQSADNPPALAQLNGVATPGHYEFTKINNTAVDSGGAGDNLNGAVATSYVNAIDGSYDFFYQTNFNFRSLTDITGSPFATSLLTVLETSSLAGVNSGLAFPLAANGIILDADRNATVAKGVTVVSRGGNSASPVKTVLPPTQAVGTIAVGSDPL
jgi:hypothetical protein